MRSAWGINQVPKAADILTGLAAIAGLTVGAVTLYNEGGTWRIVSYMLILLVLYWILATPLGQQFFLEIGNLPQRAQQFQAQFN